MMCLGPKCPEMEFMEQNQIVIYQTEDGQTQIDVRLENDTVWLDASKYHHAHTQCI